MQKLHITNSLGIHDDATANDVEACLAAGHVWLRIRSENPDVAIFFANYDEFLRFAEQVGDVSRKVVELRRAK